MDIPVVPPAALREKNDRFFSFAEDEPVGNDSI